MVIEYFLEWVETAPVNKRIEAAEALVKAFLRRDITPDAREDAEAAMTTLLEDPSPNVRIALAEAFGAYPSAPRHIILSLGQDALDVSIVVLSQSPVFHDAELVDFAETGHEKQQISVACRPWLSHRVTSAIATESCRNACYALLCNEAAQFDDDSLAAVSRRFGEDTEIRTLLNNRDDLPAEIRVQLIEQLGSQLAAFVGQRSWTSSEKAKLAAAEACDRASIVFAATASENDVRRIVRARIREDKLTVAYLVRSVCMGNISLLAHAFAELSGVRFSKVEAVLTQDRKSAFRAIYDRAGLPGSAFKVFDIAISTWRDLLKSGSTINQSRLPFLVMREVLAECQAGKSEIVDDLLVLLRKLSAEAARESAKSKALEISTRGKEVQEALPEPEATEIAAELPKQSEPADDIELVASGDNLVDDAELLIETENLEAANTDIVPEITLAVPGDIGYMGGLTDEDFEQLYAGVEFEVFSSDEDELSKAA